MFANSSFSAQQVASTQASFSGPTSSSSFGTGAVSPINTQLSYQTDPRLYGINSMIASSGNEEDHLHITLAEIDQLANDDVVMQVRVRVRHL